MHLYLDVTPPAAMRAGSASVLLHDHHLLGQSPSTSELKLTGADCRAVELVILKTSSVSAKIIRVGSWGDVRFEGSPLATGECIDFHPGDTLSVDALRIQLRVRRPSRELASFRIRCDECGAERGNDEPLFIDAAWLCDAHLPVLDANAPHVGSFDLVKEIGRGGQARVFEAIQRRTQFRAALKTPLPGRGERVMERFVQRELRIAQAVRHPRLVTLYEHGLYKGAHYAAFEYMADGSAAESHRFALKLADVLSIARDMFEGLHYLHELGVLHRDISPGNVLFRKRGGRIRAKLSDLGYAKSVDDFARTERTGGNGPVVIGTPGFLSPSRCRGEEATPADDVYGAAVLLYWMLAGATPHGYRGGQHRPEHFPFPETHVSLRVAARERFGELPQGLVDLVDALTGPGDPTRAEEGATRRALARLDELLTNT